MPNTFILTGRITAPAITKQTNNGTLVAFFNVADNYFDVKNQKSIPSFFFCKAYGKLAVKVEGYKKGDMITLTANASTYKKDNDFGDPVTNTIYTIMKIQRLQKAKNNGNNVEENTIQSNQFPTEGELDFLINNYDGLDEGIEI